MTRTINTLSFAMIAILFALVAMLPVGILSAPVAMIAPEPVFYAVWAAASLLVGAGFARMNTKA